MPKRDQLLAELAGERDYGILLLAQIGGTPNELQLVIETAEYDEAAGGLRPRHQYTVRALGVREHRLTLGVFGRLLFPSEHPLLLHHNAPRAAVHFTGRAADVNDLVLDIEQLYVSTFGPWRHLVEMPDDLNRSLPLVELLGRGMGLLGTMPLPLAERMAKVLAHHEMTTSLSRDASWSATDEHGRSRLAQLLVIDTAYIVALSFSVERLGKQKESDE